MSVDLQPNYYEDTMCIYTDGSGYKGKVGSAAAYQTTEGSIITRRLNLGDLNKHTVFEAEVTGLILALDIIRSRPFTKVEKVTILLDNQAAILAAGKPKKQSGQYIIQGFHASFQKILKERPRFQLHLAWVPGHADVKMNEVVDVEAKRAAEGPVTATTIKYKALKGDLPISIAAAKGHNKKLVAAE